MYKYKRLTLDSRISSLQASCATNTSLTDSGLFTDGSGANDFASNSDCTWTIVADPYADTVRLYFSSYDLGGATITVSRCVFGFYFFFFLFSFPFSFPFSIFRFHIRFTLSLFLLLFSFCTILFRFLVSFPFFFFLFKVFFFDLCSPHTFNYSEDGTELAALTGSLANIDPVYFTGNSLQVHLQANGFTAPGFQFGYHAGTQQLFHIIFFDSNIPI